MVRHPRALYNEWAKTPKVDLARHNVSHAIWIFENYGIIYIFIWNSVFTMNGK